MEREVGGEVSIAIGRRDPGWSRRLQGRQRTHGGPTVSLRVGRVSEYTRPEVRMAGNLKSPSLHPMNPKWG